MFLPENSLHRRLWAALSLVVLLSMIALGVVAYATQREVLETQFSAELNSTVDVKRAEIESWLAERRSDITYLGGNQLIRQHLATFMLPTTSTSEKAFHATLLGETLQSMQDSRPEYNRILIASPAGEILISPNESLIGRAVANQAALRGTLATPNVYIQDIEFNPRSGTYEICWGQIIVAPDTFHSQMAEDPPAILGVLLVTTTMDQSIYKFLSSWHMGQTGTAVLSKAEEEGVRILNQVRFDEMAPLERVLPLTDPDRAKPAQLAAWGQSGIKVATDHLGQEVMAVYRPIPEMEWGLVLKMNTREIFAPLYRLVGQTILIAFTVLLMAMFTSIWIAKTLINPIQQLVDATHAVAGGDLSVAVISTRQDEIGTLARSFTDMVTDLDRQQRQLKAVHEIAVGILGARPFEDALGGIVDATYQLTRAKCAAVALNEPYRYTGRALISSPMCTTEQIKAMEQAEASLATLHPTIDCSADTPENSIIYSSITPSAAAAKAVATELIMLPIIGRQVELGRLIIQRNAEQPLLPVDEDVLCALVNYAAIIVENAKLVEELKQWNHQLEDIVAQRTKALQEANQQLTVLDEMKTEFIYNVSHELRNPITNLTLQLDLLRNNLDSPHRERYVHTMTRQVAIMTQLVQDMLDLIQLDKMGNQIEFSTIDLNTVTTQVAHQYQRKLTNQQLHFSIESTEQPMLIIGERVQLQRAVTHLIKNAVNFTPLGNIYVKLFVRNEQACVQVTDTGIGIAIEEIPYIFQRFYRGSNVSQSTIPGSGLGLSLVREVATLHNGSLDVESRLHHGSTFRLWFPIVS